MIFREINWLANWWKVLNSNSNLKKLYVKNSESFKNNLSHIQYLTEDSLNLSNELMELDELHKYFNSPIILTEPYAVLLH